MGSNKDNLLTTYEFHPSNNCFPLLWPDFLAWNCTHRILATHGGWKKHPLRQRYDLAPAPQASFGFSTQSPHLRQQSSSTRLQFCPPKTTYSQFL